MLEIVPLPFPTPRGSARRASDVLRRAVRCGASGRGARHVRRLSSHPSATRAWVAARLQDAFTAAPYDWIRSIGDGAAGGGSVGVARTGVGLRHARAPACQRPRRRARCRVDRLRSRCAATATSASRTTWERVLDARSDLALTIADADRSTDRRHVHSLYAPPSRPALRDSLDRCACATARITTAVQSFYPDGPECAARRTRCDRARSAAPPHAAGPRHRRLVRAEPCRAPGPDVPHRFARRAARRRDGDVPAARTGSGRGAPSARDAGDALGAHFTGLFIMDFPLVAGRDDTKLSAYANDIIANGGSILVLPASSSTCETRMPRCRAQGRDPAALRVDGRRPVRPRVRSRCRPTSAPRRLHILGRHRAHAGALGGPVVGGCVRAESARVRRPQRGAQRTDRHLLPSADEARRQPAHAPFASCSRSKTTSTSSGSGTARRRWCKRVAATPSPESHVGVRRAGSTSTRIAWTRRRTRVEARITTCTRGSAVRSSPTSSSPFANGGHASTRP